jgi:hypothetical protein
VRQAAPGFRLQQTGGNCTALVHALAGGLAAYITGEDAAAPTRAGEPVHLGIYRNDEGEPLVEAAYPNVAAAVAALDEMVGLARAMKPAYPVGGVVVEVMPRGDLVALTIERDNSNRCRHGKTRPHRLGSGDRCPGTVYARDVLLLSRAAWQRMGEQRGGIDLILCARVRYLPGAWIEYHDTAGARYPASSASALQEKEVP